MFTHNLSPILFDLGFFSLRWYSLAYIIGIIFGWWYGKKMIIQKFYPIDTEINKRFDDLLNIDGIGDTQIKSLKIFFSNSTNLKVLNELQKNLFIQNDVGVRKDGLLKEKTFIY